LNNTFYDFTVYNIADSANLNEILSGTNERRILIAFLDEQREELEAFMTKIISAAKLQLEKDCLILRGPADKMNLPTFAKIKSVHKIEKAVLFGFAGRDLGFNIESPLYIPFEFNYCQFLFADKLSDIENSVERKKALWHGLQTLFL
jgi:hypothetical protein